jgi:hypothetical protein
LALFDGKAAFAVVLRDGSKREGMVFDVEIYSDRPRKVFRVRHFGRYRYIASQRFAVFNL